MADFQPRVAQKASRPHPRTVRELKPLGVRRQCGGVVDNPDTVCPEAACFCARFHFEFEQRTICGRGVGIHRHARPAFPRHLRIEPKARAARIRRHDMRQRAVITVARQAAVAQLDLPPEHHVFQKVLGRLIARIALPVAVRRSGRFDADKAHALPSVENQRVAIQHAHDARPRSPTASPSSGSLGAPQAARAITSPKTAIAHFTRLSLPARSPVLYRPAAFPSASGVSSTHLARPVRRPLRLPLR